MEKESLHRNHFISYEELQSWLELKKKTATQDVTIEEIELDASEKAELDKHKRWK